MKIKAAVVHKKGGPFVIEELELDEPRADEVLVRMKASGLCHTDLAGRDQLLPLAHDGVFGHEGAGVVEKVGSNVKNVQPGDHVVMSYLYCGVCPACKRGTPGLCVDFFALNFSGARADGSLTMRKGKEKIHGSFFGQSSFATYALPTDRNVVKVPKDLPLELLGPFGCGIQTGAGGVINSLKASPGSSIAVFGAGSVGVSAILGAVVSGCTTIIAVDVHPKRLTDALGFGATHTVNSAKTDAVKQIQKITGGGVDYSLECTGIPKVMRQAFDVVAKGGTAGLIGSAPPDAEVALNKQDLLNGRSVLGIVEGDCVSSIFIPRLLDLYKAGRFPFEPMIKTYPFDQINQAVEDVEKGKTLKAVLRF
ncbi:MAG: NAD(P)-dependent alcohol dehydrogenase [Syntrophorhabdales bacterium]|jgi:aryl-alcohol dehydrogenase